MQFSTLHLNLDLTVAPVDPRIFGGFLEHLGRAIYGGVYDPPSKQADENGFRKDVVEALRKLDFTAMRYPGGNFVSGYDWRDGVGPKASRPTQRDLAWQSVETNQFGTDEFMQLSELLNWTPMITVNLGTGTPKDARDWLEYCNGVPGTYWADKRAENGHPEPYDVKLWCLGNEMDGPWQICHVPADTYAIAAQQTARLMKMFDPSVELVLCGSCAVELPTYLEWDRKVLEYCFNYIDYISLHGYVGNQDDDTEQFLTVGAGIDRQIEEVASASRFVKGVKRSKKNVYLSFDEWNIWYRARSGHAIDGRGKFAPPLLEEVYNLEDALVAAQFLNSFVRHADVVKIANLAQIVNVIAPLVTRGDELLLQSIFYPIEMMSRRRKGVSLQPLMVGPKIVSKQWGEVPSVDASAIRDGKRISVFLVNRSPDSATEVELAIAGHTPTRLVDAEIVTGKDPKAINEFGKEPRVRAVPYADGICINGNVVISLPAMSFVAATFEL